MADSLDFFEDEDVVQEGSELHQLLTEIGYTDFECAPSVKSNTLEQKTFTFKNIRSMGENLLNKINCTYHRLTENTWIQQEQLKNILLLEPLLDDHSMIIRQSLPNSQHTFWMKSRENLQLFGSIGLTILSLYQKNIAAVFFSSYATFCTYRKYLQWTAINNMKKLTGLQNEFHNLIKKCLRIIRYDIKIRPNLKKSGHKLMDFEEEKQKLFLPFIETTIKSLEKISSIFHKSCEIIYNLLPPSIHTKNLVTNFADDTFCVNGEITFESLKNLYYTYILVQSEMLYLLALAYTKKSWENHRHIPEIELNCIINHLIIPLEKYNANLSKITKNFENFQQRPVKLRYKVTESKYQDLHIQLDLTSQKLRTSYLQISSILRDIENAKSDDETFIQTIEEKLNDAYKQIESAKSFAEFSGLLLARTHNLTSKSEKLRNHKSLEKSPQRKSPVNVDTDFQIVDQVFEEYIREEYLKPFYEEDDEELSYREKLKKLIATNFMSELKEALVEKHRVMSERESNALRRMYEKVLENSENYRHFVPEPPAMPNFPLMVENEVDSDDFLGVKLPVPAPRTLRDNFGGSMREVGGKSIQNRDEESANSRDVSRRKWPDEEEDDVAEVNITRFSIDANNQALKFPSFLKAEEEVFFGGGENSGDELVSDVSENDEFDEEQM